MRQLYINTIEKDKIILELRQDGRIVKKKSAKCVFRQSEKLLKTIDALLVQAGISLKELDSIKVNNTGGSFTNVRIGVLTANALAYALGIRVEGEVPNKKLSDWVEPIYDREPNISIKKQENKNIK